MFYVNSFPRSGNTWIRLMLMELLGAKGLDANPIFSKDAQGNFFATHSIVPRSILEESKHRHIIKSHGMWQTCYPNVPIINLLRDGRDSIYSYYHFNIDHRSYTESWEDYFERHVIHRNMNSPREFYLDSWMGNWSENVKSYMNKENVMLVKYEDIRRDAFYWVKKMMEFIGVFHIEDNLILKCVIKYTKQLVEKIKSHKRPRGVTGLWKDVYSNRQKRAFIDLHGQCLTDAGYNLQSADISSGGNCRQTGPKVKEPLINFLLPTTRMWNCGDDFIAFGVRRLIEQILPAANFIAYNRNPDLHVQRVLFSKPRLTVTKGEESQEMDVDLSQYLQETTWRFDNSWTRRHSLDFVDCCIFAGTPEWFGPMVSPLTLQLQESNIPVMYLGIGGFEKRENLKFDQLPEADRKVMERATAVTVRDDQALTLLSPVNTLKLPCPALFSSKTERVRSGGSLKIGLSTQPDMSLQPPSAKGIYPYTFALFQKLIKNFQCEVICHYIDELNPLAELGVPIHYSYDASDYFDIYDQFDLVVTTRVHGAGIAASLGIPSFVIKHSTRTSTVDGFLAEYIDPLSDSVDNVVGRLLSFDVHQRSQEIVSHKFRTMKTYLEVIRPAIMSIST